MVQLQEADGDAYVANEYTRERFVDELQRFVSLCPEIEGIFFNQCNSTYFADAVHRRLPHLHLVSWSTEVENGAATRFATEFHAFLGNKCKSGVRDASRKRRGTGSSGTAASANAE